MNKNELEEELKKANDDYHNWVNGNPPKDFDKYMSQAEKFTSRIENLELEIKKINGPIYKNIPDYGDKMTIEDFKSSCISGLFIDYDGHGYYAKDNEISNFLIWPSDVTDNKMINNSEYNFTHVIWFNR